MRLLVRRFLVEDRGATSVEYAIIAAGIATAIITAVAAVSANLKVKYQNVQDALN